MVSTPAAALRLGALLLAVLIAGCLGFFGYAMARMRAQALDSGLAMATTHARNFEEHLTQTLGVVDLVMANLEPGTKGAGAGADFGAQARAALRPAPYLRSLSLVDASGRVIGSSSQANLGAVFVRDSVFPAGEIEAEVLRVGAPQHGRDVGDGQSSPPPRPLTQADLNVIPVLRRLPPAAGEPPRWVLAAVNPEYFINHFEQLLAGAHAMDQHFFTAPVERNLPATLALLEVWNTNFLGAQSRALLPYSQSLGLLPRYLQQLEMESNGKQVDRNGQALRCDTSPVLWGEPGSNGQHAFFQMLHQGTDVLPLEIVAVRQSAHGLPGHHEMLLANALAQAQALMLGRASDCGHRHFPGNRPSTFLLLDALTPTSLGALIALQEHRVFVSGALWGINSFDQWGVELGKVLANDLQQRLASGNVEGLDASTAGMLCRLRQDGSH